MTPFRSKDRSTQAEGMGIEPTTPFGTPHSQWGNAPARKGGARQFPTLLVPLFSARVASTYCQNRKKLLEKSIPIPQSAMWHTMAGCERMLEQEVWTNNSTDGRTRLSALEAVDGTNRRKCPQILGVVIDYVCIGNCQKGQRGGDP